MAPRIFITGATGFIGRVVTEFAVADGYDVHGLSRTDKGDALLRSLGATPVRGELTSLDVLRHESAQADIVLHLAFIHDFTGDYEAILATDAAAVDALAAPLQGTSKPLVITSGTAVVEPDPSGGETDEEAPPVANPLLPRIRSERHALSWSERGVRVAALRLPQYVYGRADAEGNTTGFAQMLMKLAAQAGESVYIGEGANHFSSVYVDDAARLYLLVAKHVAQQNEVKPGGEIFNCTGSTTITYRALASAIGAVLRVPVRSITREEAEKRWGTFMTWFVSVENRSSNRKAMQVLGWQPRGVDLLTEIEKGSYVAMAERLRRGGDGH
ncbi:hypothetical protein VTN77DRAFT_8868 [Rasamsonia byssochlamydoides]|uniref:uncharacterized protein n=1 Tax=Rasamsonia byssochlamydoides TaxID=89139 RepID=UPI0037443127